MLSLLTAHGRAGTGLSSLQTLVICDLGLVPSCAQGCSVLLVTYGQTFLRTSDPEIGKACISRRERRWVLTDLAGFPLKYTIAGTEHGPRALQAALFA